MGIGAILVALFNPFSVVIIADLLIAAINLANEYLVMVSMYAVVIGGTLIAVSLLFAYSEHQGKETESLKKKSGNKDGMKFELTK